MSIQPQEPPPQGFGRYRDPVMLGAGGMGAVYRATDPSLDRFVAIKVLTHREPKYIERFRREAQMLAKIAHPSIIQIYEIVGSDEDATDPYIVMEYFDGKPLDAALKMGPLAAADVVQILRQSADGLKRAHANSVIHRDIKPANIMLSSSGEVKLLDFGIAKALDAKKDLTGNTVLGTPYYMSPEQAMGQPIDARTDIYSLGITAFHLLTGKRPFEAKSKVDVMLMQVKNPLPRLTDFAQVDARVVAIVEKMCAKQPSGRYQTCQELIDALDGLPKSLGGKQAEGAAPKTPPAPPVRKPAAAKAATPSAKMPQQRGTPATPATRPVTAPRPPAAVPKQQSRVWVGVAAGVGGALLLLGTAAFFVTRGKEPATWRVPSKGWVYPGPPAPPLKKIQPQGGYGNCIFATKDLERGKEDSDSLRTSFGATEPIFGRCYLPHKVGPNRGGEIYQEVYVDGVKKAQVLYDPPLPGEEDQLALDLSARAKDLSAGKHTIDVWIYRQAEDAETPEPLAGGELSIRK